MVTNIETWKKSPSVKEELKDLEMEIKEKKTGRLTKKLGTFEGPSGKETWYDLPMKQVVEYMRDEGFPESKYKFRIRKDGVKMFGDYVMVAANINKRPKGTILETSLGKGMVCDKCERAHQRGNERLLDIAVDRKNNNGS